MMQGQGTEDEMARGRRGTPGARVSGIYTDALDMAPRFEDPPAAPKASTPRAIDVDSAIENLAYAYVDLTMAMRATTDPAQHGHLYRSRIAVNNACKQLGVNPKDLPMVQEMLRA